MNATRLPKLVIVLSLSLVALFAYQAFRTLPNVSVSNGAARPAGIGDLRVYESQPASAGSASQSAGFGDLRVYEARRSLPNTGGVPQSAGIGDLRLYEYRQSLLRARSAAPSVGMGDLRLFEAKQSGQR